MKSAAFNSTLQSSSPTPYSIFFCVMVLFALNARASVRSDFWRLKNFVKRTRLFCPKKFPKNVPPLKKDLIRQPWWWQGLHTFGAKRQKESCCQARLVVALCLEMSLRGLFKRHWINSWIKVWNTYSSNEIKKPVKICIRESKGNFVLFCCFIPLVFWSRNYILELVKSSSDG